MDFTTLPWQPVVIAALMMVLDIVTGVAAAAKSHDIQSSRLREGLWHKAGYFGLMALAAVYEIACTWLNIVEIAQGIGIEVPVLPALTAVCVFVIVTELVSILENLCELNPEIAKLPVFSSLKPHED
jgi:phage-related holin